MSYLLRHWYSCWQQTWPLVSGLPSCLGCRLCMHASNSLLPCLHSWFGYPFQDGGLRRTLCWFCTVCTAAATMWQSFNPNSHWLWSIKTRTRQTPDGTLRLWICLYVGFWVAYISVFLSVGPQPQGYVEKHSFVAGILEVLWQNQATNSSTSYLKLVAGWGGLVFELCRPLYIYILSSLMHIAYSVWPSQTRSS